MGIPVVVSPFAPKDKILGFDTRTGEAVASIVNVRGESDTLNDLLVRSWLEVEALKPAPALILSPEQYQMLRSDKYYVSAGFRLDRPEPPKQFVPLSIEETYGFGILDKDQAAGVAKNVRINQEPMLPRFQLTGPPADSGDELADVLRQIPAAIEESVRTMQSALAEQMATMTLDPYEVREV